MTAVAVAGSDDSAGGTASRPKFEALVTPQIAPGAEVAAIGPTDREGVFVAYVKGSGFRYLDLSGQEGCWSSIASYTGPVAGEFGLFHHVKTSGEGEALLAESFVSFAEAPPRSWACFRLPDRSSKATGEAELVSRSASLPGDIRAVCAAPGDDTAALALASGQVRFFDLHTGQAAGKGLKFENQVAGAGMALARLGPGRAALVRETESSPAALEFFIVGFDAEARRAHLQLRGVLRMAGIAATFGGPLQGAVSAAWAAQPGKDRLLLCWSSADAGSGAIHASVALDSEAPEVALLPQSSVSAKKGLQTKSWACVSGYLAEWAPADKALKLSLRDARFGMQVLQGDLSLDAPCKEGAMLSATSGGITLLAARGGKSGNQLAAVRWCLPQFSLQMVIGQRAPPADARQQSELLAPLREIISGKRPRDDPAANELFSSKRHAANDKALADELRRRYWRPSQELVDLIARHRCWSAAASMLGLPELDEALAVRLLAARPELLAHVVPRARARQGLDVALRDHLPASMVPRIIELLLDWLTAHRDFPDALIQSVAPGLPSQANVVSFMRALADGCLPTLARLDADLLERVLEALTAAQVDAGRSERLYGAVRAASRVPQPFIAVIDAPAIEVAVLEF